MSFVVFETGGKQYRVAKGDKIQVEKLPEMEGENVVFNRVVLVSDGADVELGMPFLSGKTVEGKVLAQTKADKIRVFRKQPKKRMQKGYGHRQPLTEVEITKI